MGVRGVGSSQVNPGWGTTLTHGAHGPAARAGDERRGTSVRVADRRGHGATEPTGQWHRASAGAGRHARPMNRWGPPVGDLEREIGE